MVEILSEPAPKPGKAVKRTRPKGRLLIIDDNKELSGLLKGHLEKDNFEVTCAKDGEEGLALARKRKPDLVILDIHMPKMDGMEVLKTLRHESQVPVLILTSKHSDLGQVLGFKLGADDFVFKPFCAEALTARVEAILKRAAAPSGDKGVKRLGLLEVDPDRREVRVEGKPVALTIKEFDLLKALVDAGGKVLSRDYLLTNVWGIGEDCEIRTRTIDQHIAGIRQKLGSEGARVMTVPHFGYRIKLG